MMRIVAFHVAFGYIIDGRRPSEEEEETKTLAYCQSCPNARPNDSLIVDHHILIYM